MKTLLEFIVKQLVDSPDIVEITENKESTGYVTLTLHVASADMGKIIGKQGKIIRALRLLLKAKAIKSGQRFRLEIAEPVEETSRG